MSGSDRVGWGILGTGLIASLFAEDLRLVDGAAAVAVGSRSTDAAERFGERFGIPHRHGSYAELVADPDVDVVYVATPPPMHAEPARIAIAAGKAVLCEKPFTLNARQAAELVSAARAAGTFLMEAMWTRFLPHMRRVRELLETQALGEVRLAQADVGQRIPPDPGHRMRAPELGGGALLDLGVYPLSLFSMALGAPDAISAVSVRSPTGVDALTSALLRYDGGRQALMTATLDATTPTVAAISGREARLEIESPWYKPSAFTVTSANGERERFDFSVEGRGMHYQAAEVCRCLRDGRLESPVMPLDQSVAVMAAMDEIRRQTGLSYPVETS